MDIPSTAGRMKDCNEINQNLNSNNDNRININNNNNTSINSLFSDSTFNNINNSEINFSLDNNINNNQEQMNKELKGISEFKFIYKNKTYSTLISLSTDKKYLNIIAKEENILNFYYESKMKFEELKKFDKIFRACDDMEDSLKSMIAIFKSGNNSIKEITNDKLTLSINIRQLDGTFKTTSLDLFRRNQDKDTLVNNLCEQISQYNRNIDTLKDEMNKIKMENNNLKDEITNLKNLHSKEIKELREKIEIIQNQNNKRNKLDSNIVKRKKDINFIIERLKKVNLEDSNLDPEKINFEFNLLYRATEDGDSANDFHSRCDKYKNTLVLVKTKKNIKFGGFTTETWDGNDIDKEDKNAFCFSLNKMKIYNSIKGKHAIFASPNSGPAFENCIFEIKDCCFETGGMCSDNSDSYFDNHEFKCEINNGDELFLIEEVEVYEVIFK
jgi:DNA repair exonuclease SbcCD ATPase subunit